jgi:hypothetical protein
MLRSDVMYMTPIDIYNVPDCREGSKGGWNKSIDTENRVAVVPGQIPIHELALHCLQKGGDD